LILSPQIVHQSTGTFVFIPHSFRFIQKSNQILVSGQIQNYIAKVGDEEGSSVFPSGDGVARLDIQVSRTVLSAAMNNKHADASASQRVSSQGSITNVTNKKNGKKSCNPATTLHLQNTRIEKENAREGGTNTNRNQLLQF
jgi:hypothetical protein